LRAKSAIATPSLVGDAVLSRTWAHEAHVETGIAFATALAMLRSICMGMVKVAAVVVCLGVGASACVVRERGEMHERHGDYRWDHHDRR
jgi:hypothetical protein